MLAEVGGSSCSAYNLRLGREELQGEVTGIMRECGNLVSYFFHPDILRRAWPVRSQLKEEHRDDNPQICRAIFKQVQEFTAELRACNLVADSKAVFGERL